MAFKRKRRVSFRRSKRSRYGFRRGGYKKRGFGRRIGRAVARVNFFTNEKHRSHVFVQDNAVPVEGAGWSLIVAEKPGEAAEGYDVHKIRSGMKMFLYNFTLKVFVKFADPLTIHNNLVRLIIIRALQPMGGFNGGYTINDILERGVTVTGTVMAPLKRQNLGVKFDVVKDKIFKLGTSEKQSIFYQKTFIVNKGLKFTGNSSGTYIKNMYHAILCTDVAVPTPKCWIYSTALLANV